MDTDYNICLMIVMTKDGKYLPMPLPRDKCHCRGLHTKARGTIDRDSDKIKVNADDYAAFLKQHEELLGLTNNAAADDSSAVSLT